VLRSLIERFAGFVAATLLVGVPLQLFIRLHSVWLLILTSLAGLWIARILRRLMTLSATRALAAGDTGKARRWYFVLWVTSIPRAVRLACSLSLAACDAAEQKYEACIQRLAKSEVPDSEQSLQAVALNLQAYSLARLGRSLEEALRMALQCVELRPHVQGFRHTRGLLFIELGRYEEAIRDLEATWIQKEGAALFESERCFDLGRLWALRGQDEYAQDYFTRALRAFPEGYWAEKARALIVVSPRAGHDALESFL